MLTKRFLCFYGLLALGCIDVSATQITLRSRETTPVVEDYNLRVGNLLLDLRYNLGLIYDDNSNRASTRTNKEDGTKLGSAATFAIDWPINSNFFIQSGVTLSYIWFLDGEGADGFDLSGIDGAAAADLAFDFKVGQMGY